MTQESNVFHRVLYFTHFGRAFCVTKKYIYTLSFEWNNYNFSFFHHIDDRRATDRDDPDYELLVSCGSCEFGESFECCNFFLIRMNNPTHNWITTITMTTVTIVVVYSDASTGIQ